METNKSLRVAELAVLIRCFVRVRITKLFLLLCMEMTTLAKLFILLLPLLSLLLFPPLQPASLLSQLRLLPLSVYFYYCRFVYFFSSFTFQSSIWWSKREEQNEFFAPITSRGEKKVGERQEHQNCGRTRFKLSVFVEDKTGGKTRVWIFDFSFRLKTRQRSKKKQNTDERCQSKRKMRLKLSHQLSFFSLIICIILGVGFLSPQLPIFATIKLQ